jgi:CRISPR-associated protein Cst2
MNIFATLLTYPAPSANYRGESEENRSVIQKVTYGRHEYPVISPEAMRNALREILASYGLPCNRKRLNNEEQLAVQFLDYPYPAKFADDFFFGYLVADRAQIPDKVVKERDFQFKRDSVLRMNLAKALEPYRHDAMFTQSPLTVKNEKSPWQNASTSALLHRETSVTAFQFPFAINLHDCELDDKGKPGEGVKAPNEKPYKTKGEQQKDWLCYLLRAISELNGVAGNHARSYFEMAPASIVIRVTDSLVAGYETYGFKPDGSFPEVVDGVLHNDYAGNEFYIGGQLVKSSLDGSTQEQLKTKGVNLFRMANQALDEVANRICGRGFLQLEANNAVHAR